MTVALAPVILTASATVSNTGKPSCVVPPLPGVTPPTTFVPYSRICLAWKVPAEPVRPWTISLVVFPTRTDTLFASHQGDDLLRAVGHVAGGRDGQPRLGRHLLAELDVRAL